MQSQGKKNHKNHRGVEKITTEQATASYYRDATGMRSRYPEMTEADYIDIQRAKYENIRANANLMLRVIRKMERKMKDRKIANQ